MSKVIRGVKNVTKGYSNVQVKVRNATSNDPWGPTGTDMSEIARLTFNDANDFYEIMDMLDKRLNDKGKNWRHVLKSLKVLDYCLHEGSELVVTWARKNVYIIKTLREFQYVDDDGRDVGNNVRVSAKELTSLILDEERLRTERSDRKTWKSRVTGIEEFAPRGYEGGGAGDLSPSQRRHPERQQRPQRENEEEAEYRLAIEASKHEAEEDERRRQRTSVAPDDDDLAKAIKLSKEEEELRRKELEESNAASLFDDTPGPSAQQPQYTGYNQGYQQQGAVDWFGNPVDQQAQQPQSTGYLNNAYSQPTGFPQQQTGFQNGFQPQQTGFDQSQFQQQQQQPQPNYFGQQGIQPQQTAFNNQNNPYAQQTDFSSQFQQQQPQQQQSLATPQAGSHNPWATGQQQQAEPLKPAQTGSNNPFASSFQRNTSQPTGPPSLNTLAEQKTATQFTQPSYNSNPIANYQTPTGPPTPQKDLNPQHARLNALLASGEGMDTFGNMGDLRIPAQHTAPGTFVNSSGQGLNRIHANQTGGNNPFFNQQFTGASPQQQQQAMQTGGFQQPMPQQQQNRMVPAQTGPALMNGFGASPFAQASNNPFGGAAAGAQGGGGGGGGVQGQGQGQQQHPQQQQTGSLIDL
ncbi:MAG: hypothetical protein Q9193_002792 [Seirophora villosa]